MYGFDVDGEVPDVEYVDFEPCGIKVWPPAMLTDGLTSLDEAEAYGNLLVDRVTVPRNHVLGATHAHCDTMRVLGESELLGITRLDICRPDVAPEIMQGLGSIDHVSFLSCVDKNSAALNRARITVGKPPFENDRAISRFLAEYGIAIDSGANMSLTNNPALVHGIRRAPCNVGTVGSTVTINKAGTWHAQALTTRGGTVRMPQSEVFINDSPDAPSVLGIHAFRQEHRDRVDGCTDLTNAQVAAGMAPWLSIDDEELLLVKHEDLLYMIVIPLDDDAAARQHYSAFSACMLTDVLSSRGRPSLEEIVFQADGAVPRDLPRTPLPTHSPQDITDTEFTLSRTSVRAADDTALALREADLADHIAHVEQTLGIYHKETESALESRALATTRTRARILESQTADAQQASAATHRQQPVAPATPTAPLSPPQAPPSTHNEDDSLELWEFSYESDDAHSNGDPSDAGGADVDGDVNRTAYSDVDAPDAGGGASVLSDSIRQAPHTSQGNDPGGLSLADLSISSISAPDAPLEQSHAETEASRMSSQAGSLTQRRRLRIDRTPIYLHHLQMAHASAEVVRRTLEMRGVVAFDDDGSTHPFHCDSCAIASTKMQHRGGLLGLQHDMEIQNPGTHISIDVFYLAEVQSLTGVTKALVYVETKSRFYGVAPYSLDPHAEDRYQLGGTILRVILNIRRLSQSTLPIVVHSDLALDEYNAWTEEQTTLLGAVQFLGAAHHSNSNAIAERAIQTLRAMARYQILHGGLPSPFSFIAFKMSAEIYNDLVGKDGLTPRQRLTGQPNLDRSRFDRVMGQLGFAHIPTNKDKQAARGRPVVYIGRGALVNQCGYLVWCPVTMKAFATPSVRYPRTAPHDMRFPYLEGLFLFLAKEAREQIRRPHAWVQPIEQILPSGEPVSDLLDPPRVVRRPAESGKGFDLGEVSGCRYAPGAPGTADDLLFQVTWQVKKGRGGRGTKHEWYNYEELAPLLIDDSGVELIVNFAWQHPIEAEQLMTDATGNGTMLYAGRHDAAKRAQTRSAQTARAPAPPSQPAATTRPTAPSTPSHRPTPADEQEPAHQPEAWLPGRLNETTWTHIRHALRDAKTDEEREKWREAASKELRRVIEEKKALKWCVQRPGDIGPMRLSLPCKIKVRGDLHGGTKEIVYKVRCVAGASKKEIEGKAGEPPGGWDCFSATVSHEDLLLFFAIAAELGLELYGIDVQGAYLEASAQRENLVFEAPEGLTPPPGCNCLRATKAIYGWAEAGKWWKDHLEDILQKLGFAAGDRNKTWWYRKSSSGFIMLATVVDDLAAAVSSTPVWEAFRAEIEVYLPIDNDVLTSFIGIDIMYDRSKGVLKLSQKFLIEVAMERGGINSACRKYMTPMAVDTKVSVSDCPAAPEPSDVLLMQRLLGTLQYISLCRPDIKKAINSLARVASNPSKEHVQMCLRVVKYLAHTRDLPLVFSKGDWTAPDGTVVPSGQMVCFVDASFGDSHEAERMRSRTGFMHMRAGAAFQAKSRLQSLTAGSSCQAEVVALYEAGTDIQGSLQNLIRIEIPHLTPVWMLEDNSSCISVMSASGSGRNSRHYLIKYFYISDLCNDGTLLLRKVDTRHQLADGLTKDLERETFERHRYYYMGHHALSDAELEAFHIHRYTPESTQG
jgi:hypothetical protein